ncbi:peptide chain release factor-like protein, putative [Bodo saltans]|uniref:Peptide chain release factor-like protein, putative n=1 Tax=Bodo saltans TaxID=75058 RepID=A0A0S4JC65_BODSA|nr:peptide chain release factor-like protein, putative [Bodo saltans]|eukprot:CUG87586.1 peptide chain release factor-like protein, putative [Bodo saltans]
MTAGATSSKSSLIGSSTVGSVPSPLWMGRRHFGGGKMTGGVRKTSDIAASIALYEGWTLQPGTRDALKKKFPEMHLLVWQYVASLHKMYHSLLTLQERPEASGRMEDFLRAEVKNVLTKSSFSFVRWQQIYQNEVDDTTEVAKILNAIDVTVGERAALAPSSDMTADQVAEMKSMFDEELADSLEKLATRHLQDLQAVIHRRVAAFDVLGSSSRTWIVEVVGKAGGEEASIFASELLEILKNYAKNVHEWNVEAVEEENAAGASIPNACKLRFTGDGVYRHLRHEIGVHKVQRVPVTDADGKMQTSTAVVTMMPVLDPIAVNVRDRHSREVPSVTICSWKQRNRVANGGTTNSCGQGEGITKRAGRSVGEPVV